MGEIAYGHSATMHMLRASEAGVAPTGENYYQMPFYTSGFGASRTDESDQLAGQGRDPQPTNAGDTNVAGSIVVPVDPRYFGFWLTGLLGDPVTTEDTGVYTHVFKSGKTTLPDYGLQIAQPDMEDPRFDLFRGVKVNTLSLSLARSGALQATLDLIGLEETLHETTQAGTPQTLVLANFGHPRAVLKKGENVLAKVRGFNFSYSNNLDPIETVNNAGLLEGLEPGLASLTGNAEMYFGSGVLLDDAIARTPVDMELSYTISASLKLTIALHELYFDRAARSIDGPGGINYSGAFKAAKNTSAGAAMTVTLINNVAGTVYVPPGE